jgi:hypothetical protein
MLQHLFYEKAIKEQKLNRNCKTVDIAIDIALFFYYLVTMKQMV